jgi:hypothetical protein
MCLKKLLRKNNLTLALILLALSLTACSEREAPKGVAAKVGNETLTEAELQDALKNDSTLYRQEYVRNWIETRVFYEEAKEQNITESEKYKRIVNEDEARIAGGLLIEKYLNENEPGIERDEELNYFEKHKTDFTLSGEAFVFNRADFSTKIDAQNFRYVAMEKNWEEAAAFSKKSNGLIKIQENIFKEKQNFRSDIIKRLLSAMDSSEVSIIFPTERKRFTVVQLLKKFRKGEIPDFQFVQNEIQERLLAIKRKKLIKKYKEDLYSKHNAEIYR